MALLSEEKTMVMKDIRYTKLAKYYDLIHYFRNYEQQAEFLNSAIKKYLPAAHRILDIACGTGNHAIFMTKKGYDVTGIDLSQEMLNIAEQKIKNTDLQVEFTYGDMRDLKFSSEFDVVYCLGVSFMELRTYNEINSCLNSIRRTIKPNGLFIFDVSNGWEMLSVETRKDFAQDAKTKVIWLSSGYIDKLKRAMHLDYTFIIQESNKTAIELGVEELRIFFPNELRMLLINASFKIEAMLGDRSLETPFKEDSLHIVMVNRSIK
jgi:ubiquinone/menaquinone biosynthesis C-methylase UbiE